MSEGSTVTRYKQKHLGETLVADQHLLLGSHHIQFHILENGLWTSCGTTSTYATTLKQKGGWGSIDPSITNPPAFKVNRWTHAGGGSSLLWAKWAPKWSSVCHQVAATQKQWQSMDQYSPQISIFNVFMLQYNNPTVCLSVCCCEFSPSAKFELLIWTSWMQTCKSWRNYSLTCPFWPAVWEEFPSLTFIPWCISGK